MKLRAKQYLYIASIQKFDMNPFVIPLNIESLTGQWFTRSCQDQTIFTICCQKLTSKASKLKFIFRRPPKLFKDENSVRTHLSIVTILMVANIIEKDDQMVTM
jgi:hypothetical protein